MMSVTNCLNEMVIEFCRGTSLTPEILDGTCIRKETFKDGYCAYISREPNMLKGLHLVTFAGLAIASCGGIVREIEQYVYRVLWDILDE